MWQVWTTDDASLSCASGRLCPEYVCQRKGIENAEPLCQRIPGAEIDRVLADLLLELINPVTLDVALTVQQELQARLDETDRLRRQQVERAATKPNSHNADTCASTQKTD